MLSGALRNVAVAEAIQARSVKTLENIEKVAAEVKSFDEQLAALNDKAVQLNSKFRTLSEGSESVAVGLSQSSTESLQAVEDLRVDLQNLSKIVADFANAGNDDASSQTAARANEVAESVQRSKIGYSIRSEKIRAAALPCMGLPDRRETGTGSNSSSTVETRRVSRGL
mgnify:FL=1